MKKILSAVLSALFVLTAAGFAACGESGGNGGNGGNGAENGITPETAHCVTQPRRPGDGAVGVYRFAARRLSSGRPEGQGRRNRFVPETAKI